MRIEIAKRSDGAGVLRCTRDDGTVVWRKQPRHGAHFALHDLVHFAAEASLGYSVRAAFPHCRRTCKGSRGQC